MMLQGAILSALRHRSANSDGPIPARCGLSRSFGVAIIVSPGLDRIRQRCGASIGQTSIRPLRNTTVVRCDSTKRSKVVPSGRMMASGVFTRYALDGEIPLFQRMGPFSAIKLSSDADRLGLKTT